MTETITRWWRDYGYIVVILVIQSAFIVIWGTRLDSRVDTLENRGSPQAEAIAKKLGVIEFQLSVVAEELKKHEAETRK